MISDYENVLNGAAAALKTNRVMELDKKAAAVMAENKAYEKKIDEFNDRLAAMRTKNMMAGVKHLGNVNILTAQMDGMTANELKSLADKAKEQMINGVVVLASNTDGKITFVAMAMKEAVAAGVHCGNIIRELTAVCGGKGGGKPDMAQGGGKDAMKIDDALAMVDEIVTTQTSK